MHKQKNILIINYHFPPFPGVGGRRWAKFSKYLAKKDFLVYVIAAKNPYSKTSAWGNDIIYENIKVTYLPNKYPKIFLKNISSLNDKITYRFFLTLLKASTKGTIYDLALYWEKVLYNEMVKIIEANKIKNIIATGAPFRVLYYVSKLKKEYSDINIISDFRDPWIESEAYGMLELSKKRLDYEKMMEETVIAQSNKIITPCPEITKLLRDKYPNNKNKILSILHAFDEDYSHINTTTKVKNDNKMRFIYGGTLDYIGLERYIFELIKALKEIKINYSEKYNRLSFTFYTNTKKFTKLVAGNGLEKIIHFRELIPHNEFVNEAMKSDFLIMLNNYPDVFRTKFYDYLPFKKMLVVIADTGRVSDYITENKIGYHVKPGTIYEDILNLVNEFDKGNTNFNNKFNINQFSYSNITNKLIELFI
jgi:glycosyltransferase involved in cell wall biosynthesis